MNDPTKHQPSRDRDKEAGLMLWYWLPVIGGGIALAFVLIGWLIGS